MKGLLKWIIFAFVFVAPLGISAQVEFVAKVSKKKLGLNERLRIDFEMNEDGDNFEPPDFEGFRVLGGPNQSISNSWINGKRSYSKTYSFFLAPLRKGPITIGEAITVVYKLYVSNQVSITSNWREIDSPKYADFWSQTLDQKGQLQIYEGQYRGEDYRYVVLRTTVLYPQKTGELSIEPLTLDVPIDVRSNRRDFFGRFMTTRVNKTISAGRRTINVKPLPIENRPEDFTGAVGNFNFDTSISRTELDAQESLEYSVTVRGQGNLKLFELPKPQFPNAFEVYEPARSDKISTRSDGMRGSVSEVYTLVPQNQGNYPIADLTLSYFDPDLERYVTKKSQEHVVNVINGPKQESLAQNTEKQVTGAVTVDTDRFRYIKLESDWVSRNPKPWFGTWAYWRWVFGLVMLIPLWFTIRLIRQRYLGDTAARTMRQRKRLIAKYLSEAKAEQNNPSAFYASLERSLHLFLKAELKLETSGLSKENIRTLMTQRQVEPEAIDRLIGLIERCERARYAPSTAVDVQNDYSEAQEVISMVNSTKK